MINLIGTGNRKIAFGRWPVKRLIFSPLTSLHAVLTMTRSEGKTSAHSASSLLLHVVEAFLAWVAGGGGPVAWDMIRCTASMAASSKIVLCILDQIC